MRLGKKRLEVISRGPALFRPGRSGKLLDPGGVFKPAIVQLGELPRPVENLQKVFQPVQQQGIFPNTDAQRFKGETSSSYGQLFVRIARHTVQCWRFDFFLVQQRSMFTLFFTSTFDVQCSMFDFYFLKTLPRCKNRTRPLPSPGGNPIRDRFSFPGRHWAGSPGPRGGCALLAAGREW